MKLNITIYKNRNWCSIYNGDTLVHSGETNDMNVNELLKSLGYTIVKIGSNQTHDYCTIRYNVEVK